MIEILFTLSVALNIFLLYKYVPIWFIYRRAAQMDKEIEAEIEAEIVAMGEAEELTAEQCDPKNWLPTGEELEKLLDEDEDN
jgi:hypothetical protein